MKSRALVGSKKRARFAAWGALLGLTLTAGSAWGQAAPSAEATREARERFGRGVDLSRENRFDAAMVEFRRAYELTRNPAVLYNISITYEAMGQFVEALDAVDNYLRDAPAAVVDRNRADAQTAVTRLRGRVGTLVVAIEHPRLEVRLNNVVLPAERLRTGMRVNSGRLRLSLSAPGRVSEDREVELAGGDTRRLTEPLREVQTSVGVECNVAGAEVLLDGQRVAETPVVSPLPVTEGPHQIEVRRPGYAPYQSSIIARGTGARVTVQLAWLEEIPTNIAARLVVRSEEGAISATLDGRRITVDGSQAVPPGPHRLRVERENFLPTEREVNLRPTELNEVRVVLLPTPAFRERYLASARAGRIAGGSVLGVGLAALIGGGIWFGISSSRYLPAWNLYQESTNAQNNFSNGTHSMLECPLNFPNVANSGLQPFLQASRPALPTQGTMLNLPGMFMGSGTPPNVADPPEYQWRALQCVNTADADRSNAALPGFIASAVVTGVGLAATLAGVIVLATAPSPNRFDRQARRRPFELPTFSFGPGSIYMLGRF